MHLRYQIVLPDKAIRYETDSLADAKRQWRYAGSGAIIRDVLHEAGLVERPGDDRTLSLIVGHMIDHLPEEVEAAFQRPVKGLNKASVRAELWGTMLELVERTLVNALTTHPDLDVQVKA